MSSIILGVASLSLAAAGTGYSIYAGERANSASRKAAGENARLQRMQATATAAVQRFQAQLNYKVAMAEAQVATNNAIMLRQAARTTEGQGHEAVKRLLMQSNQMESSVRSQYGKSGVAGDSGSPVIVQAYNAGIAQLARMDTAYEATLKAREFDWQGTMQDYQAALLKETAKQYQYAEQMANWTEKTGVIAANAQHMASNAISSANLAQNISGNVTNFASSLFNFSQTYSNWKANQPPPTPQAGR
jgi:hypothetical protein